MAGRASVHSTFYVLLTLRYGMWPRVVIGVAGRLFVQTGKTPPKTSRIFCRRVFKFYRPLKSEVKQDKAHKAAADDLKGLFSQLTIDAHKLSLIVSKGNFWKCFL